MPSAERPRKRPIARGASFAREEAHHEGERERPTAAFAMPSRARAAASWPAEAENAASTEATTIPPQP